jgi:hypothetical protein
MRDTGHADGALARCRTLHEIAVVAEVLSAHEPSLAARSTRHQAVRALEFLEELDTYGGDLDWEPRSEDERRAADAHV